MEVPPNLNATAQPIESNENKMSCRADHESPAAHRRCAADNCSRLAVRDIDCSVCCPWRAVALAAQRKILGSTRGSRVGFGGSPKRTLLKIDITFLTRTILANGRDHSAWISNRMVHRRPQPKTRACLRRERTVSWPTRYWANAWNRGLDAEQEID